MATFIKIKYIQRQLVNHLFTIRYVGYTLHSKMVVHVAVDIKIIILDP